MLQADSGSAGAKPQLGATMCRVGFTAGQYEPGAGTVLFREKKF